MITTENNQVAQECQQWIEMLRNDRSMLIEQQAALQSMVATQKIPHDQLPSVDHFENQFDIQLANVNHLKHAIKEHLHTLETTPSEHLSAPHFTIHESLSDQVLLLSSTIEKLKIEFANFYH